ncbi:hypothetical protein PIB30_098291, partial [Stylosanthes scabra]|nr:hypothetical protein [Stylosanthes scabra]
MMNTTASGGACRSARRIVRLKRGLLSWKLEYGEKKVFECAVSVIYIGNMAGKLEKRSCWIGKKVMKGVTFGGDWRSVDVLISTRFGALESQRKGDYN